MSDFNLPDYEPGGVYYEAVQEFFPSDEARLWLFSPHRLLGGQTPADRIQQGNAEDVLALIDQLRDGTFV